MMKPQLATMPSQADLEPQITDGIRLHGAWLTLAQAIWVLIALLSISLFIVGTVVDYEVIRAPCSEFPLEDQPNCFPTEIALHQLGLTWDGLAMFYIPIATVAALPWILIGCLVFWRKSRNTVGLLFSLALVTIGSNLINPVFVGLALDRFPELRIPVALIAFVSNLSAMILLYLFPDGRFVPRWTRWLFILWAGQRLYSLIIEFLPPSLFNALWTKFIDPISIVLMLMGAIYVLIFRYRHSAESIQRQQIKWVITALVIVSIFRIGFQILSSLWQPGFFELFLTIVYLPLYYLGVLFAAVCFGISISRYRLWDVDILINRALVYSLLTAMVVGIYVIVVGILGTAIQGRSNLLISILATGLVAVLVQPLRDRLQRSINRLMYGERDDPVTVLSRLGERLEGTLAPDAVLPSLLETVAQTLKLPYVAIQTTNQGLDPEPTSDSASKNGATPTIAYGNPMGEVIRFPLIYQSETIGQLVVAPRAPGEALSPMDHHLLENIAHQAGMAVHAVNLTADLQRSRQRLVTTREEERRRLRRDLHDGLGPNLASQGLKLAAVKQLLGNDQATSAALLLDQVMAQNQSTVDEVRRLVHGLRPPALDELGLVAAIRDYVAGMDGSALQIEIREPAVGLPALSAAVEVAAYRIVLEALTNVIRHAQANRCVIRFSFDQKDTEPTLQIEIHDDGIGLPSTRRVGVGTRSMHERAEELGGTCVIEPMATRGTSVCVRVPLIAM